jgi:hypothetical protein
MKKQKKDMDAQAQQDALNKKNWCCMYQPK